MKIIKRNSWRRIPQSEMRNSAAAESEGGQKFLPPNPLPFCPPERKSFNQNSQSGFSSKKVRTSVKNDRQISHSEFLRDVASRLRRSALNFAGIFQAFFNSSESVRSAMRKFEPIFLFPPLAEKQSDIFFDCLKVKFKTIWTT